MKSLRFVKKNSIPVWFDWKFELRDVRDYGKPISIPVWFDWKNEPQQLPYDEIVRKPSA